MEMATLNINKILEYKREGNEYLLCNSDTWVSENEFSISYLPLVESFCASNLQVEFIKFGGNGTGCV